MNMINGGPGLRNPIQLPTASLPLIGYRSKLLLLSRLTLTVCFCPKLRRGDIWVLSKPRSQRKGSDTLYSAGQEFSILTSLPIRAKGHSSYNWRYSAVLLPSIQPTASVFYMCCSKHPKLCSGFIGKICWGHEMMFLSCLFCSE